MIAELAAANAAFAIIKKTISNGGNITVNATTSFTTGALTVGGTTRLGTGGSGIVIVRYRYD